MIAAPGLLQQHGASHVNHIVAGCQFYVKATHIYVNNRTCLHIGESTAFT
jgi:hypothetical protein